MEENTYINFEEGRKFLANDHSLFLKRFYDVDLEQSVKGIKISHLKKDWVELKRTSHSLKGTSSYIGATRCRAISELLQNACAENPINEEKVNNLVSELVDHLDSLMIFLRNYFNTNQSPSSDKNMKKSVTDVGSYEESKDEQTTVTIKKLVPPVSRVTLIENSHTYDEEEVDAYEEINKQWRCTLY
jgi:HPt (histidine-containing phosphotransfer) domain-containing protein